MKKGSHLYSNICKCTTCRNRRGELVPHKSQLDKDISFLRLAKEVSKNSSCLSRKIGSVLVKDKTIVSIGYNGPARGVKHCNEREINWYIILNGINENNPRDKIYTDELPNQCPRRIFNYKSGEGLHLCQAAHSERNAIVQAARLGIATKDTTLYCACPLPCKDCMGEIVNAGISRIVCFKGEDYDRYSRVLVRESKIELTEVDESNL